jgi:TM2 domain-containing membrane protein YozV
MAKKQSVTGILWLFMLHRFYLGKHLSGVIQIVTGGGILVWWIIDGISIFKCTITDSSGKEVE